MNLIDKIWELSDRLFGANSTYAMGTIIIIVMFVLCTLTIAFSIMTLEGEE